ncbi:hypothetical protein Q6A51_25465 [Pseudomonas sp. KFB-139]|uniref:Uncharacterized protein n=1 Tax=Pseudomonas serbiensis TaxID=3064350 RepID=A0ABT9CXA2_9PSED|nr:hypothetical protein [Pseudomonas sp. KFB-138]MDO7930133.1 hypothetical protein [Pseudomonas sp. KFB-138]
MPAGSLVEGADVDRQAPGLDHAAVGPVVRRDGQAAAGDEVATGLGEVGGGDVEGAGTGVQQVAVGVEEARGVEDQVAVGDFHGAVAVVELGADLEVGGVSGAE